MTTVGHLARAVQRTGPRARTYTLVRVALPGEMCTLGGTGRRQRCCAAPATYLGTMTYTRTRPRPKAVSVRRPFCAAHVRYWMAADRALHRTLMEATA